MGGTERFQENGIIQLENLVKRYVVVKHFCNTYG